MGTIISSLNNNMTTLAGVLPLDLKLQVFAMFSNFIQHHLLGHLATSILVLKEDLRVAYSNSSAEVLFEISGQRSKGTPFYKILHENNASMTGLEECIRTGESFADREVELCMLSGTRVVVDYTVTPIAHRNRNFMVMEIHPRDRLQRIGREEDLLSQQESSRMLVRGLAHEIKNPLGGIRGAAQLLDKVLREDDRDYTHIIIQEADRLCNLVDRMLGPIQFFRQDSVNIHEVLERVINLIEVESEGKITLKRDYDPSIPELTGDKEQLIQALLNIARNSLQALAPAGSSESPKITFRTRPLRKFTIGHKRHRLAVRIDIIDNGTGIAQDLLNSIFYPMVSGRPEGTGLGLSITQSIISQHEGLVECESEPGMTKFTIFMPLEQKL